MTSPKYNTLNKTSNVLTIEIMSIWITLIQEFGDPQYRAIECYVP